MSEYDSTLSDEELMKFLYDHAGGGLDGVTDRDLGEGSLEPHFASQLVAIRSVLERNREAEEKVSAEIKSINTEIRERSSNPWMEYHYVECLHAGTFLDAAHSMAAVGLLSPLIESLFDRVFCYIEGQMKECTSLELSHERFRLKDPWNYRYVCKNGRRRKNIVKGILQLSKAIGLEKYLPSDLDKTLSVLFKYRNKMFHCGFEWRDDDLRKFANLIDSNKWTDCFIKSESNGNPWIFYMSRRFTDHCLDTVDRIIDGFGAFQRSLYWKKQPTDM